MTRGEGKINELLVTSAYRAWRVDGGKKKNRARGKNDASLHNRNVGNAVSIGESATESTGMEEGKDKGKKE